MAKKIFGLDISDRSIEALVITKPIFGKPKIATYARTMLPANIINNGTIKDPEKLALKISELLASAQPRQIKTPFCILAIPESQVFTTIFKLPAGLKRREIANSIPYQAEEVIPFKAGEIYFDFKTISKDASVQEIFYVAVPMSVVDGYVDVLKRVNLKPLAFDLESISLARALMTLDKESAPKLLMDIGMRTTNLNIFEHQGVRQNLSFNVAGNHFTKAIAKGLSLPLKEAEKLKHRLSFTPKTDQEKSALKFVETEFKKIFNATKKLLSYFETENHAKVDEIILAGGSALFPGLDQYLADQLKIKVEVGKPWEKFHNAKHIFKDKVDEAVLFANVTGLAMRSLIKDPVNGDINLLPLKPKYISLAPEKSSKHEWKSIYTQLAVFIILVLAFVGLLVFRQKGDILGWIFPPSNIPTKSEATVDPLILEELRNKLLNEVTTTPIVGDDLFATSTASTTAPVILEPATTTPTTTKQIFTPPPAQEERVKIKPTTLGYLNVRQGPGVSYAKVGEAEIGKIYTVIDEKNGWYQIQLNANTAGWVIATYVDKIK